MKYTIDTEKRILTAEVPNTIFNAIEQIDKVNNNLIKVGLGHILKDDSWLIMFNPKKNNCGCADKKVKKTSIKYDLCSSILDEYKKNNTFILLSVVRNGNDEVTAIKEVVKKPLDQVKIIEKNKNDKVTKLVLSINGDIVTYRGEFILIQI